MTSNLLSAKKYVTRYSEISCREVKPENLMSRSRTDSSLRLLNALLAQGDKDPTYRRLAEVIAFSPRTVAASMSRLREEGFVADTTPNRLGPAWGMVLAVAMGTESCRAGLVDANGQLLCRYEADRLAEQPKLPPKVFLRRIADAVGNVVDQARADPSIAPQGRLPLLGLATAWPAPIRGSMRSAGSILRSDWLGHQTPTLPVAVAKATGFPESKVHVLNDANAHMMAASFDHARARADEDEDASRIALLLRIGGGIGASTMILAPQRRARLSFIDSTLLGGARSLAGELAHLPIDNSVVKELNERATWVDGLAPLSPEWRCSCGHSGHLESLASGTAWVRRMEESGVDVRALFSKMNRFSDRADFATLEDAKVTYALEDLGRLIGRTLAGPILLLDPHLLFLTGSFAVEPVVQGILAERETWRHVFGDALSVEAATTSDAQYVGVRGAGLAVIRSHVYRRFQDWLENPGLGSNLIFHV